MMTKLAIRRFKFRFYLNKESECYICTAFNNARAAYNLLLSDYIFQLGLWQGDPATYKKPQTSLKYFNKRLTLIIEANPWLKTTLREALTQSAVSLNKAFSKYFLNRKEKKQFKGYFPKFKSRFDKQSFSVSGVHQFKARARPFTYIKGNESYNVVNFTLPGCSTPLDIRWYHSLPSTPSTYSISRDKDGRWYISFVVEAVPKLTHGQDVIGIDLGIKDLMTFSNGVKIPNEKKYLELDQQLKRFQRKHAKSMKGGANREKLRLKIASIYRRIKDYADHFLHNLTRILVNRCRLIGLETLKINNMIKNHKLARSIMTANWGKFNRYLKYKAEESGWCNIVWINPFFPSSKRCSCCGAINTTLTLKDRKWTCVSCDFHHDRDVNAARNIEIEASRLEYLIRPYENPGKVFYHLFGRIVVFH